MATVTKENIGELHERLTLKLEKGDYLDKLEIFAQPLPVEMDIRQLDVNNPADYVFHFEVGMKPEFQLPDLDKAKTTKYVVTVTGEMIDSEIARLQNRYGNMKDKDVVDTDDDVINVQFKETDENDNEIEGGIAKDNSLLVKYFKEDFRNILRGKVVNDFVLAQLDKAFDTKELEWIISDLGLDKENPASAQKRFKIIIAKIGLLEKRELNEDFFNQLYAGQEIKTEEDFRNKIKEEIQAYWNSQSRNQLQHQAYHELLDHTSIHFPEGFLKKWMKTQGDQAKDQPAKTDEEIEKEFPSFLNQLRWTLISDKIVNDNAIQVQPEEIKSFVKQQLFSYMGSANLSDDQPWVKDYIDKMMKDRKYVEDAYGRIQTQKVFEWAEMQLKPEEKDVSVEEFTRMNEEHQHHHH